MSIEPGASFGERLRRLRERAGLTQEALAERAGLTTNAIGVLERGERRRPYPHTVRALADALGLQGSERDALFAAAAGREKAPRAEAASSGAPALAANPPSVAPPQLPQLPPQLTSLVGRDAEAATVEQLLRRPAVRLLTLLGPGGVGKTRLAIEVAGACAAQFADGVAFVPLAPLDSPELVVATIVRTLGLQEASGTAPLDTLTRWLRERHFLLLLDNFEHVLDAAIAVGELLGACPRLHVLVTSREALHLRGEQEYPVPPLAFPRAATPSAEALLQYDGVRLFVQRAQAVRPDFALSEANAAMIAQICARLDGLPLAIELAAARTVLLSPQALLSRLEQAQQTLPLQLLSGGARDLPARQQTMRATIAWSYDLLSPAEQSLFRRLSVFARGATLDAIEAVCAAEAGAGDVTELVASLVHKHLVGRAEADGGEPRFEMLETIRAYGAEQLHASGEYEAVAQAHARYFLALAEAASPHLLRREQARWFRALDGELNNVRAAVRTLLSAGALVEVTRLVWALWRFWWVRGLHLEAWQVMRDVLGHGGYAALAPLHRAQAELLVGSMAWANGDMATAERMCAQSLALSDEHDERRVEAIALMMLGATLVSAGADAAAEPHLARSVALFHQIGELWGAAFAITFSGLAQLQRGSVDQALVVCAEGLATARQSGDDTITHQALYGLAVASQIKGDHARAAQSFVEGLALCVEAGDRVNVGYFVKGIAEEGALLADAARGVRLLGAAQALMEATGVPFERDAASQPHHAQLREELRALLGDEAFAQLWAEGRAQSVQQTYREAQEMAAALLDMSAGAGAQVALAPRATAREWARSKLQPPRSRTDLLLRERLLSRIRARLPDTRLILASAPAGAGKTTLLASVVGALGLPFAWATLDADDNDPERFLQVLLAALSQLAPPEGRPAGAAPFAERAQGALDAALDAFAAGGAPRSLLVLDDLHALGEPAVFGLLAHLIEHLPPNLVLALATRHEPPLNLTRLRARRELLDLGAGDLRFTLDETTGLLNERLALNLGAEELATLHQRTEGWAAGLSLLAASLDTIDAPDERTRFLAHLAGTERYLFDYLADEVLNRQDPFARAFLLETSVLPELTPQACQALTGRLDAAAVLDDLYRRNLFLVRLTDGGRRSDDSLGAAVETATYRYHDLFRVFLRERLRRDAPEWFQQLRARAAQHAAAV
jgi:predicted ATPase/transcriptional regulator with XRE-family HTH domain